MLTLNIVNKDVDFKVGRFIKADDFKLTSEKTSDIQITPKQEFISVTYIGENSWESKYLGFIADRQQRYNDIFKKYQANNAVLSVNGLKGDLYILAGRGIALDMNDTSIILRNTMYNTENAQAINKLIQLDDIKQAIDYLWRYQMCIYHSFNLPIARSIGLDASAVGYYYRYMGTRARWNNYVYTSCLNRNVISSGDSIFITLGFNNTTSKDEEVTIDVKINPNAATAESTPDTVESTPDTTESTTSSIHPNLIWYGIFLDEVSPTTTNLNANEPGNAETQVEDLFSYSITRNGYCNKLSDSFFNKQLVDDSKMSDEDKEKLEAALSGRVWLPDPKESTTADQKEVDVNNPTIPAFDKVDAPTDITNPNNCVWSPYGGEWTEGSIHQKCTIKPMSSFKYVYAITKHPGVNGYTRRSSIVTFNISITYTWSAGTITKTYTDVPCYMQEYIPDSEKQNAGNDKRYILVATEDMGNCIVPPTTGSNT
jgi:hypothetical protein